MGENGSSTLHFDDYFRLPYPICQKAPTLYTRPKKFRPCDSGFCANDTNYTEDDCRKRSLCSTTVTQLPVTYVSGTKRRWDNEAHIQSENTKSVCSGNAIQSDKHSQNTRVPTAERLASENRSFTSLFSPTDTQSTQALSTPLVSTANFGNELPALRVEFRAENIRSSEQLDGSISASKRNTSYSIPGRLFNCQQRRVNLETACDSNDKFSRVSGMDDKLRKVCFGSQKDYRILRHYMGPMAKSENASKRETVKITFVNKQCNKKTKIEYKRNSKPYWTNEFCQLHYSAGQAKLSTASEISNNPSQMGSKEVQTERRITSRTSVVVSAPSRLLRNSRASSDPLHGHRRFRPRLGSADKRYKSVRRVVENGREVALQSQRTTSHTQSLRRVQSEPTLRICSFTMRQQNRCCILTQRGRNEIANPSGSDVQNISSFTQSGNKPDDPSYSRHIQRGGRSTVTTTYPSGMASSTSRDFSCVCTMGNSCNRSVCVESHTRSKEILLTRLPGRSSGISQCIIPSMDLSVGMGFPSSIFDTQSITTSASMSGYIPHCSTEMGKGILEGRSKKSSNIRSLDNTEPSTSIDRHIDRPSSPECIEDGAGGMEMWGWNEQLKGWSPEQRKLLMDSWRPSTLKSYKTAWSRWVKWAKDNTVIVNKPTGSDLARFLCDLHYKGKFSYSTILSHKSVVSTLCDFDSSERLSSHPLVKRMLKSISLSKPSAPKPPIWDVEIVFNHISMLDTETESLYEISKITAAILLLYSGRRIHDLTLLRINSNDCVLSDDYVILWPAFGSKTDSINYRQSGWKLNINKDNKNLDPVHWIKRLIMIGCDRRKTSNSENLCISTCGKPRPATRSIIGGWIKNLLKEAGVMASAGSFRAAVASKSWIENSPIEDILARGNWRSEKTFKRFYCRQILPKTRVSEQPIQNLFTPVTT